MNAFLCSIKQNTPTQWSKYLGGSAGNRTRVLRAQNRLNQAENRTTPPKSPFPTFINLHNDLLLSSPRGQPVGKRLGRGANWQTLEILQLAV